jgi:SAM-dependent methyltransferase
VLEVGCGAGRFTEILLAEGALVTSVDLSAAVDANAETCPPGERHRIAQADVNALPFRGGEYDVVVGLGIVQHTTDPERTMRDLIAQGRPGGIVVFDHYLRSWRRWTRTLPLARALLRRLPPDRGLAASTKLYEAFSPFHRTAEGRRFAEIVVNRVSPITYYGDRAFPGLDEATQREWSLLDTHDSLTDWFKHTRSVAQIEAFLRETTRTAFEVWEGGNGVEARVRLPAGGEWWR